jgi:hypothetical protein
MTDLTPDQPADPITTMPPDHPAEPGYFEAGGRLYRQVRLGFAWIELSLLGLLVWSIVATQVSGYQAPLWSGMPQLTAIGGAFASLLAIVLLGGLLGLVRKGWLAFDRRRADGVRR